MKLIKGHKNIMYEQILIKKKMESNQQNLTKNFPLWLYMLYAKQLYIYIFKRFNPCSIFFF